MELSQNSNVEVDRSQPRLGLGRILFARFGAIAILTGVLFVVIAWISFLSWILVSLIGWI